MSDERLCTCPCPTNTGFQSIVLPVTSLRSIAQDSCLADCTGNRYHHQRYMSPTCMQLDEFCCDLRHTSNSHFMAGALSHTSAFQKPGRAKSQFTTSEYFTVSYTSIHAGVYNIPDISARHTKTLKPKPCVRLKMGVFSVKTLNPSPTWRGLQRSIGSFLKVHIFQSLMSLIVGEYLRTPPEYCWKLETVNPGPVPVP